MYGYITPEDYETAEKNGINAKNLEQRIRVYGWDKERAMTQPVRKLNDRSKWLKIAEKKGINYQAFMTRVHVYGWSEEKAAMTPMLTSMEYGKRSGKARQKYDDKYYELAEEHGISRDLFNQRMRREKISPYEAATRPKATKQQIGKMKRRNRRNDAVFIK